MVKENPVSYRQQKVYSPDAPFHKTIPIQLIAFANICADNHSFYEKNTLPIFYFFRVHLYLIGIDGSSERSNLKNLRMLYLEPASTMVTVFEYRYPP